MSRSQTPARDTRNPCEARPLGYQNQVNFINGWEALPSRMPSVRERQMTELEDIGAYMSVKDEVCFFPSQDWSFEEVEHSTYTTRATAFFSLQRTCAFAVDVPQADIALQGCAHGVRPRGPRGALGFGGLGAFARPFGSLFRLGASHHACRQKKAPPQQQQRNTFHTRARFSHPTVDHL